MFSSPFAVTSPPLRYASVTLVMFASAVALDTDAEIAPTVTDETRLVVVIVGVEFAMTFTSPP